MTMFCLCEKPYVTERILEMTFIEGENINLFSHRWCFQDESYLVTLMTGSSIILYVVLYLSDSVSAHSTHFCTTYRIKYTT